MGQPLTSRHKIALTSTLNGDQLVIVLVKLTSWHAGCRLPYVSTLGCTAHRTSGYSREEFQTSSLLFGSYHKCCPCRSHRWHFQHSPDHWRKQQHWDPWQQPPVNRNIALSIKYIKALKKVSHCFITDLVNFWVPCFCRRMMMMCLRSCIFMLENM